MLTSTNPAGGTAAWRSVHPDPDLVGDGYGINDLSCPSVSLCVAVDGYASDVLGSTNPTGGSGAWTITRVPYSLENLWCPFISLCLAADEDFPSENVISQNPTGHAGAWRSASLDGATELSALSCPSRSLCMATDQKGNALLGQRLPTMAQIKAMLRQALKPSDLLKRSFLFTPPTAGRLTTRWRQKSATPNTKPTLLATSHTSFSYGHTIKIRLTLTRAGKRALRTASHLALIATATFTPKDNPSSAAAKPLTLNQ